MLTLSFDSFFRNPKKLGSALTCVGRYALMQTQLQLSNHIEGPLMFSVRSDCIERLSWTPPKTMDVSHFILHNCRQLDCFLQLFPQCSWKQWPLDCSSELWKFSECLRKLAMLSNISLESAHEWMNKWMNEILVLIYHGVMMMILIEMAQRYVNNRMWTLFSCYTVHCTQCLLQPLYESDA